MENPRVAKIIEQLENTMKEAILVTVCWNLCPCWFLR